MPALMLSTFVHPFATAPIISNLVLNVLVYSYFSNLAGLPAPLTHRSQSLLGLASLAQTSSFIGPAKSLFGERKKKES